MRLSNSVVFSLCFYCTQLYYLESAVRLLLSRVAGCELDSLQRLPCALANYYSYSAGFLSNYLFILEHLYHSYYVLIYEPT